MRQILLYLKSRCKVRIPLIPSATRETSKSIKRVLSIFTMNLTAHLMSGWYFNPSQQDSVGERLTM